MYTEYVVIIRVFEIFCLIYILLYHSLVMEVVTRINKIGIPTFLASSVVKEGGIILALRF